MASKAKPPSTPETPLSAFRARIKKQYGVEPVFVAQHEHEKTDGGIYEFNVTMPDAKAVKRCYIWRFASNVAGGQMAMDVPDVVTSAPRDIVEQWLVANKAASKKR
jgi:hypothetical protein